MVVPHSYLIHSHFPAVYNSFICFQFSSVAQSCPTLCDPVDCSTPGFPVHPQLPELIQTHVHRIGDAIQPSHPLSSHHLILCHPLLLLPSIISSIRVFSNESVLRIRWPKYWSFSFSFKVETSISSFVWRRLSDSVLVNRIKQKC